MAVIMTFFAVCTPSINSNTCVLERRMRNARKEKEEDG